MLAALECHEFMDGATGFVVTGGDAQLSASWQIAGVVADDGALCGHDSGARYLTEMYHGRRGEIARLKSAGDLAHVLPDARDAHGVADITLELDAAAVG